MCDTDPDMDKYECQMHRTRGILRNCTSYNINRKVGQVSLRRVHLPLYGKRYQVQVAEWNENGKQQPEEWTYYLFPYNGRRIAITLEL